MLRNCPAPYQGHNENFGNPQKTLNNRSVRGSPVVLPGRPVFVWWDSFLMLQGAPHHPSRHPLGIPPIFSPCIPLPSPRIPPLVSPRHPASFPPPCPRRPALPGPAGYSPSGALGCFNFSCVEKVLPTSWARCTTQVLVFGGRSGEGCTRSASGRFYLRRVAAPASCCGPRPNFQGKASHVDPPLRG